VEISFAVTEILTFNKWTSEVYHFQKRAFSLTFHVELTWTSALTQLSH